MSRSRPSGQRKGKSLRSIIRRVADGLTAGRASGDPSGARGVAREWYGVEPLEPRTLFVILGPEDPAGEPAAPGFSANGYEFLDGQGSIDRVSWHDMTVELIGVLVPALSGAGIEQDLQPAVPMPPTGPYPNLYAIYIMQSSVDSWISIAEVPALNTTGAPRPMEPFAAGPALLVNNAGTGDPLITYTPGAVGEVLLGARTATTVNPNIPIMTVPFNQAAVPGPYRPPDYVDSTDQGTLTPGIFMSPVTLVPSPADPTPLTPTIFITETNATTGLNSPNDIGRFFFGGVITGTVDIPAPAAGTVPAPSASNSADPELNSQGGNVGVFYAGAILTGDATGVLQVVDESASDQTPNFIVGGDIRDLITSGDIGGSLVGAARPDLAHYFTGFDLQVAGTVGDIYSNFGNYFGTFDVQHNASIYGLPDNVFTESELEWVVETGDTGNIFQGGIELNGGTGIVNPPLLPSPPFSNDLVPNNSVAGTLISQTLGSPQYLGAIKETDPKTGLPTIDSQGNYVYEAQVTGTVQGEEPAGEIIDNYAIPLMAGQTITVVPSTDAELVAELIDPDGRIVASDENKVNSALTMDTPFQYTAPKAGIYTVSLIDLPGVTIIGYLPYTLTVYGVGDMGLGSLVMETGDIYDGGYDAAFDVDNGDMGAMIAGGILGSGTVGPTPVGTIATPQPSPESIVVANGNLRELEAASIGFDIGENAAIIPFLQVPNGSVGLLKAFDPAGILAVQTRFNQYSVDFANPALPANSVTASPIPVSAVGGDFQMIDGAGTVLLGIACNQAIGDILAGNMATIVPSFIEVNADNTGDDGRIDLIDSAGDIGLPGVGGPGIVTNDGGDVRYIECGGIIYRDAFFGAADTPDTVVHAPGQSVTFTDDDGATLTLTPVGNVGPNPAYTPAAIAVDPTIQATIGPELVITDYPIRGSGGAVLVNVSVSDISATDAVTGNPSECSLDIVSNATASGAVAEISRVQIEGLNANAYTPTGPVDTNGLPTVVNAADATSTTAATGTATTTAAADPTLSLSVTGTAEVDILNVVVTQLVNPQLMVDPGSTISGEAGTTLAVPLGNALSITNNTPNAEMARILANSIGTITSAGTIGVAKSTTAEAVLPLNVISYGANLVVDGAADGDGRFSTSGGTSFGGTPDITDSNLTGDQSGANPTYPFMLQKTGVSVNQSIETISANEGLGNILAVGSIGSINPNADGKLHPGYFAGIVGPIVAGPLGGTIAVLADLNLVSIGQGIQSSGTGIFSLSGLYGVQIGTVSGANADIRGQVESLLTTHNISLQNGSLIDAQIIAINERIEFTFGANEGADTFVLTYTQAVPFFAGQETVNGGYPVQVIENPFIELGAIRLTGNGGIIGSYLAADDIGTISVAGFGILESTINTQGAEQIQSIVAGGYGIRGVTIDSGSEIGSISATGNGQNLSVASVSPSVRLSETQPVDPITGFQFNPLAGGALTGPLNDIDAYLGTSVTAPVSSTTDTGVLEDDVITADTSLGNVTAQTIRVSLPVFIEVVLPDTPTPNIPQPSQPFQMQMNIGQTISKIQVRGLIDGLSITTGKLGQFRVGGSVSRLGITVAGAISNLIIPGNFGQIITNPATGTKIPDSYIQAVGPNGSIESMKVQGNLYGNVTATGRIVNLTVSGNVFGTITAQGQAAGLTLGTFRIGGSLQNGSLVVDGSAGSIIASGGLGAAGSSITIEGNLNLLNVGASHAKGSILASAMHIEGVLKSLVVYGQITGALTVDSDLTTMRVTNDGTSANVIDAPISVGGKMNSAMITGGNVDANFTVNSTINSFTISKGSLMAGTTLQSQLNAIRNFNITGGAAYGLFGNLLATGGLNQNVNISGNIGDGTDAASILAYSGSNFHVHGSILANVTVSLTGALNLLQVGGNIEAGAVISAHPLKKLIVGGTNNGTITSV